MKGKNQHKSHTYVLIPQKKKKPKKKDNKLRIFRAGKKMDERWMVKKKKEKTCAIYHFYDGKQRKSY